MNAARLPQLVLQVDIGRQRVDAGCAAPRVPRGLSYVLLRRAAERGNQTWRYISDSLDCRSRFGSDRNPASITSTPSCSNCRAILQLSSRVHGQPGSAHVTQRRVKWRFGL